MSDQAADMPPVLDKSQYPLARFDAAIRAQLRATLTDELIAEHAAGPSKRHGDALERVLNYFRRAPVRGKYLIVCTQPHQEWRIVQLSGRRGTPPVMLEGETFQSEEEARHGVFLRRVRDLMAS